MATRLVTNENVSEVAAYDLTHNWKYQTRHPKPTPLRTKCLFDGGVTGIGEIGESALARLQLLCVEERFEVKASV